MPFNIDNELEKLLIMKADKQKLIAPLDAQIAEQEKLILNNELLSHPLIRESVSQMHTFTCKKPTD